jgi:hypothetical protein
MQRFRRNFKRSARKPTLFLQRSMNAETPRRPAAMSKHEKPMILRYWEQVGGTLLLEYHIVPRSPGVGRRLLDAVIIVDGERRIASPGEKISLDRHDLIIVQAKTNSPRHVSLGAGSSRASWSGRAPSRSRCARSRYVLRTTPSFARSPRVSISRSLWKPPAATPEEPAPADENDADDLPPMERSRRPA